MGKWMRRLSLASVLMVCLAQAIAIAGESVGASCDRRWEELSTRYVAKTAPSDYAGLLSAWKRLDRECKESPRYWARLGLIYFYLDQPRETKKAIASVRGREAEPLIQLVDILADIALLRNDGSARSKAELERLEYRLLDFAENNPRDPVGLSLLADVIGGLGRYDSAILLYQKVLEGIGKSARTSGVMRNLTIAYADAGRYQEAYDLAGEALQLKRSDLTADMYFMCAVARSQASLGKIDGAQNTLTLLALKRPEVESDPHFKSAVAFVIEHAQSRTSPRAQ